MFEALNFYSNSGILKFWHVRKINIIIPFRLLLRIDEI